jgi:HK97 family phage portal protein
MMLLEEGMTLEKIGLPQKDSQYLETRQHQIEEIARWFNLPPHVLKDLTHATFSNIESQAQELVKYSLRPWMVRVEQHCDLQILKPESQTTHYHKWNAEGLLRGDSAARSEFYKSLWNMGAVNIDEIREKEDMNPLPDGQGKVHFIPLNTTTLERAIAGETEPVEQGEENETV